MPQAADMAAIHYRTLNKKREKLYRQHVQIDKKLYKNAVGHYILNHDNITLVCDMVENIIEKNSIVTAVATINNTILRHLLLLQREPF